MKYKILKHDQFFPNDVCLKGEKIFEKNVPNNNFEYIFVKKTQDIEFETKGIYKKVGSISNPNYDEFNAINKKCKEDYDNNFFNEDKIICPII